MWKKYWFRPVQAHNGYLETYLNGGFVGLAFLIAFLASTGRTLVAQFATGGNFAAFRFGIFAVALLYNWTEAMFNGTSLVWFMLLCASVTYRSQPGHSSVVRHVPANLSPSSEVPRYRVRG